MDYLWQLTASTKLLFLHFEGDKAQGKLSDATLAVIQNPLNSRTLLQTLLKGPVITLSIALRVFGRLFILMLHQPYGVNHG